MRLIFIDDAKPGMTVAKDIIVEDGGIIALVRPGTVLTEQNIRRISECGVSSMYVIESWEDLLLPEKAGYTGSDFAFSVPKSKPVISDQLRDEAMQSLKEIFSYDFVHSRDTHESLKIIKHLDNVTEKLVGSLMGDHRTLVNIVDLKSYDEYTYHHSLSVAVLSIAVAQSYGMSKSELVRIGKSAMMHDIGKTSVPLDIIHKELKLDADELAIVKNHSRAGYDYLSRANIVDGDICAAVLSHHEKFDGTGYPNGLKGDEIPLWSRIIAVADVYDALTSNRPYRQPMQPAEAVEYIMGGAGSFFDYDVVKAFTKRLEPYPVGSMVELSDSQTAVVMDTQHPTRPIIKIVKTGETVDLFNDKTRLNIVINRILQDDQA